MSGLMVSCLIQGLEIFMTPPGFEQMDFAALGPTGSPT